MLNLEIIWLHFFWGLMIRNQVANLMCILLLVKTTSSQLQMENGNPHLILHLRNLSPNNLDPIYYCTFVPKIQYIIGPQLPKWEKPLGVLGLIFSHLWKCAWIPKHFLALLPFSCLSLGCEFKARFVIPQTCVMSHDFLCEKNHILL
jgi:hypothetical protein